MELLDVSATSQLPPDDLTRQIGEIVREIVLDEKLNLNAPEQQAIVDIMLDDMLGLGPLEPLLADELVTDIMVNGPKQVYTERRGKLELTDVSFQNDQHVLNIARPHVSKYARRVNAPPPLAHPLHIAGTPVNITPTPHALQGT